MVIGAAMNVAQTAEDLESYLTIIFHIQTTLRQSVIFNVFNIQQILS